MKVDTVEFQGTTVRVTYHKHPQPRGWWFARVTHEFLWLPDVRTPDQVLDHYLDWLAEEHDWLAEEHGLLNQELREEAEFVACGRGLVVYLSPLVAGMRVKGGHHHIYLVSEDGTHGALRIPTSLYHRYPMEKFKVGASRSRSLTRPRRRRPKS
jgi:hypothetical protein